MELVTYWLILWATLYIIVELAFFRYSGETRLVLAGHGRVMRRSRWEAAVRSVALRLRIQENQRIADEARRLYESANLPDSLRKRVVLGVNPDGTPRFSGEFPLG
jgi:hypothetical protein